MTLPRRQEGVYYEDDTPGYFGIVFFRTKNECDVVETSRLISRVWHTCSNLQKGIKLDVPYHDSKKTKKSSSFLMAFGRAAFKLPKIKRSAPSSFSDKSNFLQPYENKGSVLRGTDLKYAKDISDNHATTDHFLIQIIASNQFEVNRAVVEIIRDALSEDLRGILESTKFYTGFRSNDYRNWLGFLDGQSNMRKVERKGAIWITSQNADLNSPWTINGTYLAFLRIELDLVRWWEKKRHEQELMIGRDKFSGCPIIGVSKYDGKPIKSNRCPVSGTKEVFEKGNEAFREYRQLRSKDMPKNNTALEMLKVSHIAQMRSVDSLPSFRKVSNRIFRQGFEFLDSSLDYPGFKAGLNFVSFQNTPERIIGTISYLNRKKSGDQFTNFKPTINEFFAVRAAGLFFVPPSLEDEQFPGENILIGRVDYRSRNKRD